MTWGQFLKARFGDGWTTGQHTDPLRHFNARYPRIVTSAEFRQAQAEFRSLHNQEPGGDYIRAS